MKRIILCVFAGIMLLALAGCMTVSPVAATSNPLGSKVGQAKTFYLFSVIPFSGDHGIAKAARNGGITLISTVDSRRFILPFGIGVTVTTIVTGE
jgi:hypothetical protein